MIVTFVKWFDASNQVGTELTRDEFVNECVLYSAGVLAAENKNYVSLAVDYYPANGTYRHVVHIPKVNIIKRRDIRVAK